MNVVVLYLGIQYCIIVKGTMRVLILTRPSLLREPGQYGITSTTSSTSSPGSTASPSYSRLPGLSAVPGQSYGTLPESRTLPDFPRRGSATTTTTSSNVGKTVSLPRKSTGDEANEVSPGGTSNRQVTSSSRLESLAESVDISTMKEGAELEFLFPNFRWRCNPTLPPL